MVNRIILLAFIQISDSCGCILEGHPEGESLLLTYSICELQNYSLATRTKGRQTKRNES